MPDMYERHKLCDTLTPDVVCIVVEQYQEGPFVRLFHKHVKRRRLSEGARRNLLRALVMKFSNMSAELTVLCHLNSTGKDPAADKTSLGFHISHAEPGVLRSYCGINTKAWSDQVTTPREFRPKQHGDAP